MNAEPAPELPNVQLPEPAPDDPNALVTRRANLGKYFAERAPHLEDPWDVFVGPGTADNQIGLYIGYHGQVLDASQEDVEVPDVGADLPDQEFVRVAWSNAMVKGGNAHENDNKALMKYWHAYACDCGKESETIPAVTVAAVKISAKQFELLGGVLSALKDLLAPEPPPPPESPAPAPAPEAA